MSIADRVQAQLGDLWGEIVDHPLVVAVEDGSCPDDVLRLWTKQKFCQQREFASNLAVVFSRMPLVDRALRGQLAGNLYGERDHTDLYLRFAGGLGLDEEQMWHAEPLPATAAFSDRLYRLAREGSMADVAASVHVGLEGVTIQHFPKLARGLATHYGLTDDALAFFTVHDEADADHFQHGIDVLTHYTGGDSEATDEALRSARHLVKLYSLTYSACWASRDPRAADRPLAAV